MLYAIGDVHGRYDLLVALHAQIMEDSKQFDEINTIVMLGDYIDRGPDSNKVVIFVRALTEKGEAIALKGNHEDMMAMRDRLRSKGVPVMGPVDHGMCVSMYFAGLENLSLEL